MSTHDTVETSPGWLSEDELDLTRRRVPMVYVDAVPVRLDHLGQVERVGTLLRGRSDGTLSRAVVSGRVLYGELVRDALWRHLNKDLGAEAEPQIPPSPAPFTIAEYFPDPDRTGFHDHRQHAISLCFVVPVEGICQPSHDALDFAWLTPAEASSPEVIAEMSGGQDRLLRLALAHVGQLP